MSEHLTEEQFERYRRRQLEPAELLRVCDHLGECDACRRRAEVASHGDAAFLLLRSEVFDDAEGLGRAATLSSTRAAHLTPEETAAFVDGTLSAETLRTVSDHLSFCDHCALSVEDLRAFKLRVAPALEREHRPSDVSTPSVAAAQSAATAQAAVAAQAESGWRRAFVSLSSLFRVAPVPAFGAALAVVLLTVFGWLVWRSQRETGPRREVAVTSSPAPQPSPFVASPTPTQPPEPAPTAQPTPSTEVAQLKDGGARLSLDREGRLSGAEELPPAYREMLKGALSGRRIERSAQLKGLARPGSSLMSADAEGRGFSVLEPVGSVLLTDRPTFRWSALEGASGYVVELYDEAFNLIATSPQLDTRSWAAPQPLARGKVYAWQVRALKDGQEIKSPRPPAPQARFRVLDRAKAAELSRARRAHSSSHLTLALLYADAGLLNESERELRLLLKSNPDSELARNLLRQVRALQRRSE